jgi:hypothetical protein
MQGVTVPEAMAADADGEVKAQRCPCEPNRCDVYYPVTFYRFVTVGSFCGGKYTPTGGPTRYDPPRNRSNTDILTAVCCCFGHNYAE